MKLPERPRVLAIDGLTRWPSEDMCIYLRRARMKREEKQKRTPGNQKPSSENRTLDVHVDDSELIACLEEVEGKAGKGIPKPTPNLASAVRRKSSTSTATSGYILIPKYIS
eukprot:XP_019930437.1 PREDICTED: uncharacterized protein LOC109621080 [Crassostrea gigas]